MFEETLKVFTKAVKLVKKDFFPVIQTMILIFVAVLAWQWFQKSEIQQAQVAEIQKAVAPNETGAVSESAARDKRVHAILETLRDDTNSDRARVYQFHNGQRSLGDVPFVYASATHEVTGRGVSSEIKNLQRLPSSIFSEAITDFMQGKTRCKSIEEIGEGARSILENQAVVYSCSFSINGHGDILGIVTINWTGSTPSMDEVGRADAALRIASARISDVFYIEE